MSAALHEAFDKALANGQVVKIRYNDASGYQITAIGIPSCVARGDTVGFKDIFFASYGATYRLHWSIELPAYWFVYNGC